MILPALLLTHRSSSPAGLVIWCVIGLCAGIYLFVKGFRLLQRRKLILDTPVSKIRSASMGMVELSGLAVGPYTMVAPITARPCYFYRTIAWEWKQRGRDRQWVKVAAEAMHLPFFLDDNTGRVMVDPRGADLDLHCDFQQEFCDGFFTTKQEAPPNVRNFLFRHGVSTTNKIKVEEFCIKPKNALFVLGSLQNNPGLKVTAEAIIDPEAAAAGSGNVLSLSLGTTALSFAVGGAGLSSMFGQVEQRSSEREEAFAESVMASLPLARGSSGQGPTRPPVEVIQLSPDTVPAKVGDMTQQQKIAAALLKAGISNPAAWQAAGVTPAGAPAISGNGGAEPAAQQAAGGFDANPAVVVTRGRNNPTFLISWRSQRDLAKSMGWQCSLMIWGGPVLALACLYGLLEILHLA
ncbi:MAG TPA: GIDE domain-containing protein [Candidatus Binatia bacterium]|nr:GIDE domain-containing protein [Candidatus Binatia bacterium]